MFSVHNPLLITSAVNVLSADSLYTDPMLREYETRSSLEKILGQRIFPKIVLCDGTGKSIFTQTEIARLRDTFSVELEQLTFSQDRNEVSRLGKGYGEIQIYRYAQRNSRLLLGADSLYKLSGRWDVINIDKVVSESADLPSVFFTYYPRIAMFRRYVASIFFKTTRILFDEIIEKLSRSDVWESERRLEPQLYVALQSKKREWVRVTYPAYRAVSGSTGRMVDDTRLEKLRAAMRAVFAPIGQCAFCVK